MKIYKGTFIWYSFFEYLNLRQKNVKSDLFSVLFQLHLTVKNVEYEGSLILCHVVSQCLFPSLLEALWNQFLERKKHAIILCIYQETVLSRVSC